MKLRCLFGFHKWSNWEHKPALSRLAASGPWQQIRMCILCNNYQIKDIIS